MPAVAEYILKLSLSITVVCLLYQLLFRRFTFYVWNRFFLLLGGILSFVVPFINLTPVLRETVFHDNAFVQGIPVLQTAYPVHIEPVTVSLAPVSNWTAWDIALWAMVAGMAVMFIRLVVQLWSLRQIMKQAKLVAKEGVHLYALKKQIPPFSFGSRVYINPDLHDPAAMEDIVRHEMVHVKQRHSIDILYAEWLCVFNWYNPFSWWLKAGIKQNLEFLADRGVLQGGSNKKAYQYLLLKVAGYTTLPITSPFNFSSLKKRIAMMNKVHSTKQHLLAFLIIIPVAFLLLLSCRREDNGSAGALTLTIMGILRNQVTLQPIKDAVVKDSVSGIHFKTGKNGFYKLVIPRKPTDKVVVSLHVLKSGYSANATGTMHTLERSENQRIFVLLSRSSNEEIANGRGTAGGLHFCSVNEKVAMKMSEYDYAHYELERFDYNKGVENSVANDPRPVHIIEGIPNAFGNGARAWFDESEVAASPEFKVWADGKIMSVEEANARFNRFELKGVGAWPKDVAKARFGLDCNLLILFKDSANPAR